MNPATTDPYNTSAYQPQIITPSGILAVNTPADTSAQPQPDVLPLNGPVAASSDLPVAEAVSLIPELDAPTPSIQASEPVMPSEPVLMEEPLLTEPAATSVGYGIVEPIASVVTPVPPASTDPAMLGFQPIVPPTPPPAKKRFNGLSSRIKLVGAAGAALILIVAVALFGFYLPNRPQTVWRTGLDRSGKALKQITATATEQKTMDSFKKSEVTATVNAKAADATYSGTMDVKFDATKANGNISIKATDSGNAEKVISAKFLGELKENNQFPDVYLQFTGMKALGLDAFIPSITDYEGKWIAINADYLKSLGMTPTTADKNEKQQITSADVTELAKSMSDVTADYVFTSNPQKAVFVQRKYVGKETVDNIKAYHYVVGVNKDHTTDYCKALINTLAGTQIYKKILTSDETAIKSEKEKALKDCDDTGAGFTDKDNFDMWVDAHYKLIYKVRFTDRDNSDAYTELGQKYKGGNDLGMFITSHDGKAKSDTQFTLNSNLKTHISSGTVTSVSTGSDVYDLKITLEAKPYSGDIDVAQPAGSIPIQEILQKLGIDASQLHVSSGDGN